MWRSVSRRSGVAGLGRSVVGGGGGAFRSVPRVPPLIRRALTEPAPTDITPPTTSIDENQTCHTSSAMMMARPPLSAPSLQSQPSGATTMHETVTPDEKPLHAVDDASAEADIDEDTDSADALASDSSLREVDGDVDADAAEDLGADDVVGSDDPPAESLAAVDSIASSVVRRSAPSSRALQRRAYLWHLHRDQAYVKVVEQFELLAASRSTTNRHTTQHPSSIYHYLHSLAQLNQYHRIIAFYKGHSQILRASPHLLDLVLTACIREPKDSPAWRIFCDLRLRDKRLVARTRVQAKKPRRTTSSSSSSSSLSSSSVRAGGGHSDPSHAAVEPYLTEKASNALLKALLLADEPDRAFSLWRRVFLNKQQHRAYRLQAQAAHPLIMHMIEKHHRVEEARYAEIDAAAATAATHATTAAEATPTPSEDATAATTTKATSTTTPAAAPVDVCLHLTHAFNMYLGTSFVERVIDMGLLLRIFNEALRSALDVRNRSDSAPAQQQRLWLVSHVYRFILHHNEDLLRQDEAAEAATAAAAAATIPKTDAHHRRSAPPKTSTSETDKSRPASSPWSHTHHRSFVSLDWHRHFRPLIHCCLDAIERETTVVRRADLSAEEQVAARKRRDEVQRLLDTVLYDVRLTYPDYSHLRPTSPEEATEVASLERREADQQRRLSLLTAHDAANKKETPPPHKNTADTATTSVKERRRTATASAVAAASLVSSSHFTPILPLRVLDLETCEALLTNYLERRSHVVEVLLLYASLPNLRRYDAMRDTILTRLVAWYESGTAAKRVRLARMVELLHLLRGYVARHASLEHRRRAAGVENDDDHDKADLPSTMPPLNTRDLFSHNFTANFGPRGSVSLPTLLPLFLAFFARVGTWHQYLRLFTDFYSVWGVQPTSRDYEEVVRATGKESDGIDVLTSLSDAIRLDSSLRPFTFSLALAQMEAYASFTSIDTRLLASRPPASETMEEAAVLSSSAVTDPEVTKNQTFGAFTFGDVLDVYGHVERLRHVVNAKVKAVKWSSWTPASLSSDLLVARFLALYLAWRSQYVGAITLADTAAYRRIMKRIHPNMAASMADSATLTLHEPHLADEEDKPRTWSDLLPDDVLVVSHSDAGAIQLELLSRARSRQWWHKRDSAEIAWKKKKANNIQQQQPKTTTTAPVNRSTPTPTLTPPPPKKTPPPPARSQSQPAEVRANEKVPLPQPTVPNSKSESTSSTASPAPPSPSVEPMPFPTFSPLPPADTLPAANVIPPMSQPASVSGSATLSALRSNAAERRHAEKEAEAIRKRDAHRAKREADAAAAAARRSRSQSPAAAAASKKKSPNQELSAVLAAKVDLLQKQLARAKQEQQSATAAIDLLATRLAEMTRDGGANTTTTNTTTKAPTPTRNSNKKK